MRTYRVLETEGNRAAVAVTKDEQTVSGLASRLTLVSNGTAFAPYEEVTADDLTYYRVKESGSTGATIPPGYYYVYLDGKDTGRIVSYGDGPACVVPVSYCTVSTRCDDSLEGVDVAGEKSAEVDGDTVYLEGSQVTLTARESGNGNMFDRWSGLGSELEFAQGSSATSNPATILVRKSQGVRADARPVEYSVSFDSNASDVTGSIDEQKFTYGESKKLTANAFARTGYAFAGWNTAADGSGTAYADEQNVQNLCDTQGASIVLYAQWKKDADPTPDPDPDPEPEPTPAPTPTESSKKDDSQTKVTETKTSTVTKRKALPTTGDDSMMCASLALVLALMSLASIVAAQRMHLG